MYNQEQIEQIVYSFNNGNFNQMADQIVKYKSNFWYDLNYYLHELSEHCDKTFESITIRYHGINDK